MKRIKAVLTLAVAMTTAGLVQAQGRFGADSAECVTYLSFYQEYMKQDNLDAAAPQWRKAIQYCPPTASQNMLLDGMKILRRDINTYKNNPIRRKELIDSLLLLHQMRIDNYPKYAVAAKSNLAFDMINYSGKGEEQKVIAILEDAMEVAKERTSPTIVVRYMGYVNDLYHNGTYSDQEVFDAFDRANAVIDLMATKKNTDDVRQTVENLFMQSGVATCENLVKLFTPRYEANPTDKDVLSGIVAKLTAANCLDADLYVKSVESLYQAEPTHGSAYLLYKLYSNRNENEKAVEYLRKAADDPNSDSIKDAEYLLELATFYYTKMARPVQAVEVAAEAAELDPAQAGKCYMLIASVWGAIRCEGNEIEQRAPYWVAVDYLNRAKKADASLAEEANRMIANFSKYFPMQADAFMYDLMDGASYTVSCQGLRATTTVRTQK